MNGKSYGEGRIGIIREESNDAGGTALLIEEAFPGSEVDWNNHDNVRIAASRALDIADDLYELIHSNCNLEDPVFGNKNIAAYIAITAFACELYMKGMIYLEGGHRGNQLKTHRVHELLALLSQHSHLNDNLTALLGRISEIDKVFDEMRYVFEYNAFNKDYLLVFDLLEELRAKSFEYQRYSTPTLRYSAGKVVIE